MWTTTKRIGALSLILLMTLAMASGAAAAGRSGDVIPASGYARILMNKVNIREKTTTVGPAITWVSKDDVMVITATQMVDGVKWYYLTTGWAEQPEGWVHGSYVHEMTQSEMNAYFNPATSAGGSLLVGCMRVNTNKVNVRSAPSAKASAMGWVNRGDIFRVAGFKNVIESGSSVNWYYLIGDTIRGWVSGQYVDVATQNEIIAYRYPTPGGAGGSGNSGYGNSGYNNSGYGNSGYGNSGYNNSGSSNSDNLLSRLRPFMEGVSIANSGNGRVGRTWHLEGEQKIQASNGTGTGSDIYDHELYIQGVGKMNGIGKNGIAFEVFVYRTGGFKGETSGNVTYNATGFSDTFACTDGDSVFKGSLTFLPNEDVITMTITESRRPGGTQSYLTKGTYRFVRRDNSGGGNGGYVLTPVPTPTPVPARTPIAGWGYIDGGYAPNQILGYVEITQDDVKLYEQASVGSRVIGILSKGYTFVVESVQKIDGVDWYLVTNGQIRGWVLVAHTRIASPNG
ncbi:MAG: SH3 domain-containing protein [Firmicutes bacterium]|nr:SH3 domain-containing protein [Bacillota bacterium]